MTTLNTILVGLCIAVAATGQSTESIVWRPLPSIETADLLNGPVGKSGAPTPNLRMFWEGDGAQSVHSGMLISDELGRTWAVSQGSDYRAEVAASRLLWAAGFFVDQNYYLDRATIEGLKGKTEQVLSARFQRQDDGYSDYGQWFWNGTPDRFSKEMQGLETLLALLGIHKFDEVTTYTAKSGYNSPREYRVTHINNCLGKVGLLSSTANATDYAGQRFIKAPQNGFIVFEHDYGPLMQSIPTGSGRWIGEVLAKLTDNQIGDAFRAAGFNDSDVALYVKGVSLRIQALLELPRTTPQ